jgi:hypothetical protein
MNASCIVNWLILSYRGSRDGIMISAERRELSLTSLSVLTKDFLLITTPMTTKRSERPRQRLGRNETS